MKVPGLHRASKKEKIQKQEKKLRHLANQFLTSDPDAPDLIIAIDQVTDYRVKRIFRRVFFRKASIDDLFCFLRRKEKDRPEGWKVLLSKIENNKHSEIILLQIAEDIPDLANDALEAIEKLGFELGYEILTHLLSLRHIQMQNGSPLHKKLEESHKKQSKKIEHNEKQMEEIEKEDARLKELKRN